MSLRDFIRATAKDVQAALKSAQEAEADQIGKSAGGPTAMDEAEKEKDVSEAAKKKKEKRVVRPGEDEERFQKRRRKEQAQKTIHEE